MCSCTKQEVESPRYLFSGCGNHFLRQVKIKLLTEFHETALVDKAWKLEGVGEGDERTLLERFSSVTTVFQSLPEKSQQVSTHCSVVGCCVLEVDSLVPRTGSCASMEDAVYHAKKKYGAESQTIGPKTMGLYS